MASELNGGEGVTFLVREVAPKLKEALGPAYGESGGVRWLVTDGAVENRSGRGGDGLPQRGCGRDVEVASFYSRVLRKSNAGLRKEGEREVMARRGGRVMGVHACGEMGQLSAAQRRSTHARCRP
jgi:hypothetical protein